MRERGRGRGGKVEDAPACVVGFRGCAFLWRWWYIRMDDILLRVGFARLTISLSNRAMLSA